MNGWVRLLSISLVVLLVAACSRSDTEIYPPGSLVAETDQAKRESIKASGTYFEIDLKSGIRRSGGYYAGGKKIGSFVFDKTGQLVRQEYHTRLSAQAEQITVVFYKYDGNRLSKARLLHSSVIRFANGGPETHIEYGFSDMILTRRFRQQGATDVLQEQLSFREADQEFQVGFYDPYSYVDTGRFFSQGMILDKMRIHRWG